MHAQRILHVMARLGGPLRGIRVVELAGLAPGPFCGMVLGDFGASVVRVERPGALADLDVLSRGKRSVALDLKSEAGRGSLRRICDTSDVLIDPYRPGVLEGMGMAPDQLLASNPRLIVARLTGYGQHGPMAKRAGHDLNYISLAGLLSSFGAVAGACGGSPRASPQPAPAPPVHRSPRGRGAGATGELGRRLCGCALLRASDGALAQAIRCCTCSRHPTGGGLACALGIVLALFERESSGKGQVVDAAMVDGARRGSPGAPVVCGRAAPTTHAPSRRCLVPGHLPAQVQTHRHVERHPGRQSAGYGRAELRRLPVRAPRRWAAGTLVTDAVGRPAHWPAAASAAATYRWRR